MARTEDKIILAQLDEEVAQSRPDVNSDYFKVQTAIGAIQRVLSYISENPPGDNYLPYLKNKPEKMKELAEVLTSIYQELEPFFADLFHSIADLRNQQKASKEQEQAQRQQQAQQGAVPPPVPASQAWGEDVEGDVAIIQECAGFLMDVLERLKELENLEEAAPEAVQVIWDTTRDLSKFYVMETPLTEDKKPWVSDAHAVLGLLKGWRDQAEEVGVDTKVKYEDMSPAELKDEIEFLKRIPNNKEQMREAFQALRKLFKWETPTKKVQESKEQPEESQDEPAEPADKDILVSETLDEFCENLLGSPWATARGELERIVQKVEADKTPQTVEERIQNTIESIYGEAGGIDFYDGGPSSYGHSLVKRYKDKVLSVVKETFQTQYYPAILSLENISITSDGMVVSFVTDPEYSSQQNLGKFERLMEGIEADLSNQFDDYSIPLEHWANAFDSMEWVWNA